jgi:hypothetical protein
VASYFIIQETAIPKVSILVLTGKHPDFSWGAGADPEAIYTLFDFKNYVIKIVL